MNHATYIIISIIIIIILLLLLLFLIFIIIVIVIIIIIIIIIYQCLLEIIGYSAVVSFILFTGLCWLECCCGLEV